jgi:hypothetical protein
MLVLSRIVWKYRAHCPFFIATASPTFPSPNAYRIDKHELNVVKLFRRKAPRFTFIYLDASNDCRCAGLLYQRGECIAMAREHKA